MLSPETTADGDFSGRGALIESEEAAGGSWGMFVLERARWMAAAERPGELEPGPRLGLTSVLLLRERRPDWDLAGGPGGAVVLRCRLRAGEASRELSAEFAGDGEPDTLSERSRTRDWRRMAGMCVAGVLWAADAGACTTETWLEVEFSRVEAGVGVGVVDDDDAGSATCGAPVMLRKSSASGGAAAVEVMLAAIRLLQMAGTLGAALSCCAGCTVNAWIALQSATSNRIMAVSAEMTLASTRHSPVGQRNLLSQQKVRGAQRTGAFGSEGWRCE